MTWTDTKVEAALRNLGAEARRGEALPGEPIVTRRLAARAVERKPAGARRRTYRTAAVAAVLAVLLLVPGTMLAMGETVLGVQLRISDLSLAEWTRQGVQGWLASPGEPEWLSPEETARTAPFPVRTPGWLPEGYVAKGAPVGAYSYHHDGLKWTADRNPVHFFVTQGFVTPAAPEASIGLLQQRRPYREGMDLTLAPGTQRLEVAGHPAFLRLEVPLFAADEAGAEAAARTGMPPQVDHTNELVVWAAEADGSVTEIRLSGKVAPETLAKVAESLFTRAAP